MWSPAKAQAVFDCVLRSVPGLAEMASTRGLVFLTSSNELLAAIALRFGGAGFTSIPMLSK